MSPATELPVGTVTFLFTDIEGSTRLLKQLRDRYGETLADHQTILREAFSKHGGHEIDTQGDSFFVAFVEPRMRSPPRSTARSPSRAMPGRTASRCGCGWASTRASRPWEANGMSAWAYTAQPASAPQATAARFLCRRRAASSSRDDPIDGVTLLDLGEHQLKDLDEPERLYQLRAPGLPEAFPPLKTAAPTPFAGREDELAEAAAEELAARRRRPSRRTVAAAAFAAAAVGAAVAALVVFGGSRRPARRCDANSVGGVRSGSAKLENRDRGRRRAPGALRRARTRSGSRTRTTRTVSRIDPATNAVVQTIQVGAGPAGIAVGAGAVWVLNALDGTVSRIDPKTRRQWCQTIPVGNGPTAIAYGQGASG